MSLHHLVYEYFIANTHQLTAEKRFHFATRIGAWAGTSEAYSILKASRSHIVPQGVSYKQTLGPLYSTIPTGERNAHELRAPFFKKYPDLFGIHLALFRVRHMKEVYGIDARNDLFSIISEQYLLKLRNSLLRDPEALKFLSTYAINTCYLINNVILATEESLPLDNFLEVGKTYNTTDAEHIKLLIYLYTHCIIGESRFYTRLIPSDSLPFYIRMLQEIEKLINANYSRINLDNKLEFLVCTRICNYKTTLHDRIYSECEKSVSPEGNFLIDTHNDSARLKKTGFLFSEHRNVLFIMSGTAYVPHSTLVD